MSSRWDAVFIQVLDRMGPLILNLSGTPYIPDETCTGKLVSLNEVTISRLGFICRVMLSSDKTPCNASVSPCGDGPAAVGSHVLSCFSPAVHKPGNIDIIGAGENTTGLEKVATGAGVTATQFVVIPIRIHHW
jgi:hypothetical protein